jgi:membrane fusion protein, adhesin transport system
VKQAPPHQLSSTSADLLQPNTRNAQVTVYGITGFFAAALAWSMFANVLQVSTGTGQVIPENRLKTIQSLDGGVVAEILAKPGDEVREGTVIARLDAIYAGSSLNEAAEQIAALEATSTRLKGQLKLLAPYITANQKKQASRPKTNLAVAISDTILDFPDTLQLSNPSLVQENTAQFMTVMQELAAAIMSVEEQIVQKQLELRSANLQLSTVKQAQVIARADLDGLQKLLKSGAAGKGEVMVAKARYNELRGQVEQLSLAEPKAKSVISQLNAQIDERIGNLQTRTSEQLNETQIRLNTLKAQLPVLAKRSANTEVLAPATGIIKQMSITTRGQVIRPGEIIADIVPSDSPLLVQVRVKPEDIAFIATGMPALVKLTAFDFSIFGSINGRVVRIATDSTTDERGAIYYIVDVKTETDHIERKGESWPVKVGMVANVDIVTGKQSIFQYFTKPIHRMTQSALRER